jgi:alkanesulfonate monooxygenase SsuD/methylene tetrahydromethanopterin reductase-like flavin-dependent oxidoreductase (luciferase family)
VTFGHCNFIHMTETDDEQRAVEAAREPFTRAMGTHRSFDHLRECYLIGTVGQLCARIEDLVGAGLQYLVLGPVTDDPEQIDLIAKYIAAAFA